MPPYLFMEKIKRTHLKASQEYPLTTVHAVKELYIAFFMLTICSKYS